MPEERLESLPRDVCLELLARHHFGRVAVNDGDAPVIFPVNYALDGESVVFRTGRGTKLDAALRSAPAAFEIDGIDPERRLGWSVLVRGRVEDVSEHAELQRLAGLSIEPYVEGDRPEFVRLRAETVTGRRIPFPPQIPEEWLGKPDLGNVWYGADGSDLLG